MDERYAESATKNPSEPATVSNDAGSIYFLGGEPTAPAQCETHNTPDSKDREICRLINQVWALKLLADGCQKHPSYRTARTPRTDCKVCAEMWTARQRMESLRVIPNWRHYWSTSDFVGNHGSQDRDAVRPARPPHPLPARCAATACGATVDGGGAGMKVSARTPGLCCPKCYAGVVLIRSETSSHARRWYQCVHCGHVQEVQG